MPLENAKYEAPLLAYFQKADTDGDLNFSLLDVGASGGLDPFFRQLAPNLKAVGFDPLISEVSRLNEAEDDPKIRYEACWITQGTNNPLMPSAPAGERDVWAGRAETYFGLTSAGWAHGQFDYVKEVFNSGAAVAYSENKLSLDEWRAANEFAVVDLLKVDVDGCDYQALIGAHNLLRSDFPLAIVTEAQVQEDIHHTKVAFGDIDVYLRSHGYRMLDVNMHRYSRSALPRPFKYDIFAQTENGGVGACDALYMPDPVLDHEIFDRIIERRGVWGLVKLMILYDMFGLEDFAAALILDLRNRDIELPRGDMDAVLDLLVPENPFGAESYDAYIAAFQENPKGLFPPSAKEMSSSQADDAPKTQDWTSDLIASDGTIDLGHGYVSGPDASGFVVYGPYIDLARGMYRADVSMDVIALHTNSSPGKIEIVLDELTVCEKPISPGVFDVALDFPVTEDASRTQVRISTVGGLRTIIKSVTVSSI